MEHSAEQYGLLVAYYRGSRPRHGRATKETGTAALAKGNVLDCSLLHVVEFRHAPAEVAPLHGVRAKAQCSLVGGQRFFIPPEPA